MFVSTWSNLCRLAERHSCKPCPATWAAATRATSYTHTCRYCMCASMYYNAVWHRIQACYVMHTHMHACVHQDSMQQQSDRQKDPQPGKSIYIHTYIHTTFLFPFLFIYCAKECYGIEFGQLHTYQCKCNIYMFVKCVSVCVCVCVCACVRVYTCVCAWIYVIHTLYQACRWEDGVAEAVWLKRLHISAKEPHVTAKRSLRIHKRAIHIRKRALRWYCCSSIIQDLIYSRHQLTLRAHKTHASFKRHGNPARWQHLNTCVNTDPYIYA